MPLEVRNLTPPPFGTFPKIHPIWYRHPSKEQHFINGKWNSREFFNLCHHSKHLKQENAKSLLLPNKIDCSSSHLKALLSKQIFVCLKFDHQEKVSCLFLFLPFLRIWYNVQKMIFSLEMACYFFSGHNL